MSLKYKRGNFNEKSNEATVEGVSASNPSNF